MTRKQKRLSVIAGGLAFLGAASALTFYALGQRASYFYMPTDLQTAKVEPGQRIRLGGLVEKGTIKRGDGANGVLRGHRQGKIGAGDLYRHPAGPVSRGARRHHGRHIRG